MTEINIKKETEKRLKAMSTVPVYREPDFPTYFNMIKSLLGTLNDWRKDNFRLSDKELWQNRFEICKNCEEFKNNRCRKCGCYSKIKSRLKVSKCPLNKWNNYVIIDDEKE